MDSSWVPLISGLVGAILGAAASIGTVLVQASIESRRERIRQATQLALEDYKFQIQLKNPGERLAPLSLYVDFHMRLAKALEQGPLTPEKYEDICKQADVMIVKLRDLQGPVHPV